MSANFYCLFRAKLKAGLISYAVKLGLLLAEAEDHCVFGDIYFAVSYCNQMIFGQFDNCASLLELGIIHFSQTQIFQAKSERRLHEKKTT